MTAGTWVILTERDRGFALAAVMKAKRGLEVRVGPRKRTTDQNRRMWSMLQTIADSGATWDGTTWDAEDWKEILLSGYLKAKQLETGRLVKGTEGEPVVVGRLSSSALDVNQFAEFTTMILAWMDNHKPPIVWLEREEPPVPESYR